MNKNLPRILQTRDELKDAIEKEMGEYRRESEYFSHSRLEEVDEADTIQDPDSVENGETEIAMEASESTLEAPVNFDSPPPTVEGENGKPKNSNDSESNGSQTNGSDEAAAPFNKKNPLERQVARLLAQVNGVSWNHSEFRVRYHSLAGEPRVGNYFLRLLLEEDKRLASAVESNSTDDTSKMGLSRIKNR